MRALAHDIADVPETEIYGRVVGIQGLKIEVAGPVEAMRVGARLIVADAGEAGIACEVVGFHKDRAICLPFGPLEGIRMGCRAVIDAHEAVVRPTEEWLGRVINGLGQPIDGKGPLPRGALSQPYRNAPPPAHQRQRVGAPIDLGVRALNTFTTCCRGQRMGIFAGSGVGKSVLFSMLARNAKADITIIGLIGERGREVQEFLVEDLGEEGLKSAIVVVATSDEPALVRRQAAYLATALAETFRDEGKDVLLLMDSLTRFALAQREIGLAGGEPPTSKGYTPTVFVELPKLLERAGPGIGRGGITGLYTVLVDGDDHNEPIADAVRSIVDGHIVMERAIAERGRYPAINILKSISRTMPASADPEMLPVLRRARELMSAYADMEELIRLGAYRKGSDATVDEAIDLHPRLEAFLGQSKDEAASIVEGYEQLCQLIAPPAVDLEQAAP